jgi:hypothetical protein
MRRLLFVASMWVASMAFCDAQDLSWSNQFGTVTIFGDGELETFLGTDASLAGEPVVDSLTYLEAASLPAISRAEATNDDASFAAIAQLTVTESQVSGLPFTSGGIDFASTGGGLGSGSGGITLYFLINVPGPVTINLANIRSSFTGAPGATFSMSLFRSDADGAKFGDALMSFSGSNFDASGSYQSSSPYYLLEMSASANATAGVSNSVEFSYMLELSSAVAVPEPNSTALLFAAAAGLTVLSAKRRRC